MSWVGRGEPGKLILVDGAKFLCLWTEIIHFQFLTLSSSWVRSVKVWVQIGMFTKVAPLQNYRSEWILYRSDSEMQGAHNSMSGSFQSTDTPWTKFQRIRIEKLQMHLCDLNQIRDFLAAADATHTYIINIDSFNYLILYFQPLIINSLIWAGLDVTYVSRIVKNL